MLQKIAELLKPQTPALKHLADKRFCAVIPLVLNSEGGYVNDPHDPGGPTKYGIAWNFNNDILLSIGVSDVKDLTLDQAREIYYLKYWLPSHANEVKDTRLAYIHFDAVVNCGVGKGSEFLRKLTRSPKFFEGDGKNEGLFLRLFLEYVAHRILYYTSLTKQTRYLPGWMNRIAHVILNALRF